MAATRLLSPDPSVPIHSARVAVMAASGAVCLEAAASLARELDLPLVDSPHPDFDLLLAWTGERLELRDNRDPRVGPVFVDFARDARRRLTARDPLARAIGKQARSVVDATVGLAGDALLLARAGYSVTGIERSPVVAALVNDGLDRLIRMRQQPQQHAGPLPKGEGIIPGELPALRLIVGEGANGAPLYRAPRLLPVGDARAILPTLDPAPDVVYLDPMFPPKRRRSAAVSKELRMLRMLVGEDLDADELLATARATARLRVVVKRPDHAAPLAPNPAVSYGGKLVRYDVYHAGRSDRL